MDETVNNGELLKLAVEYLTSLLLPLSDALLLCLSSNILKSLSYSALIFGISAYMTTIVRVMYPE